MKMNIILRASSSSNERAKQPFSLQSSTAKQHVKDSNHQMVQNYKPKHKAGLSRKDTFSNQAEL